MDSPGFSFEASIPFWEDILGEASYQKFEHLKLMVKHAGFEGSGRDTASQLNSLYNRGQMVRPRRALSVKGEC